MWLTIVSLGHAPPQLPPYPYVSVEPEAGTLESFDRFLELGESITKYVNQEKTVNSHAPQKSDSFGFQYYAKSRPKRHDVLLIFDGTGSMSSQIQNLKFLSKN